MEFSISKLVINFGSVSIPLNQFNPLGNGFSILESVGNSLYNAIFLNISGIFNPACVKNNTVVKNLEILETMCLNQ